MALGLMVSQCQGGQAIGDDEEVKVQAVAAETAVRVCCL